MVAVSVPCANNPPPKPMMNTPIAKSPGAISGPEAMMARKPGTPTMAPWLAIRYGSAPRLSVRDARPKPNNPPVARQAVSRVVTPTLIPSTLGCQSLGARSLARVRPTVWVVCTPAATFRKVNAAAA